MKIRAVLWDWDNTLFDSWDTIHQGWCAVSRHFGMEEQTLEEVKAFAHRSCRDVFPALFGDESDKAASIFYETVHKHQAIVLMPGAREVLDMLRNKGITLGVISNKEGNTLRDEIHQSGLSDHFSIAVGSGDVLRDKPAPDGIQHALATLKYHPAEAWYIGDTPVDVEAAFLTGCTSVVVHSQGSCKPREPDYFCHTLADLQRLLEEKLG